MSVVNTSGADVSLLVQYDSGSERVDSLLDISSLPALTRFGDDPAAGIIIEDDEVLAGSLFPVYFQYADVPGELLFVPVLDGTMAEYELLVP